jgi:uncharacterized protein DUF3105
MASRKEQKEQLRREREQREAAEAEAKRRKQLVGYGAGAVAALVVLVVLVLVLTSGGGSGEKSTSADVLPSGGSVPAAKNEDLTSAAKAAGCELKSYPGKSREHTADLNEKIKYDSNPPTEGKHFQTPADDSSYEKAPNVRTLVHSLEHGRIIIWFKKSLSSDQRANLKALYDEDTYQMILTPDNTGMPYDVAASAWSRDPVPNGTGRLLGCKTYNDKIFDAIRDFKDAHRSDGPEPIP